MPHHNPSRDEAATVSRWLLSRVPLTARRGYY